MDNICNLFLKTFIFIFFCCHSISLALKPIIFFLLNFFATLVDFHITLLGQEIILRYFKGQQMLDFEFDEDTTFAVFTVPNNSNMVSGSI